jgi:hypothetical protein
VLGQVALWIVMLAAIASGVDYYRRFNHVLHPTVADFESARRRVIEQLQRRVDSR